MARIFLALAIFAVLLLVANLVVGHSLGDLGQSSKRYEAARAIAHEAELSETTSNKDFQEARAEKDRTLAALGAMRRRFHPHIWLGIVAALVTILVNCISVTYFIGTSRWCREVVEAYGLEPALAHKSRSLKRRSFPFAFLGIMTMLGIISLGAASDPGASLASPAAWVTPHFLAAWIGTLVIAGAFYFQVVAIGENYGVINQILAEANLIRSLSQTAKGSEQPPLTGDALEHRLAHH
jgi:hypothetical protein